MLPNTLIKGFDKRRLRNFLALFFLALAVPTAALIWQAYSQLKWEAFHQYRGVAEELTRRIDTEFGERVRSADAHSFADYTFLVVSGEPSAKFVQRSPLSEYPVTNELPGVLGYFQVDAEGTFSTPLLPPTGTDAVSLGISDSEYSGRLQLALEIQAILADNRLVQARSDIGGRTGGLISDVASFEAEDGIVADNKDYSTSLNRRLATSPVRERGADLNGATNAADDGYSQLVFDELNRREQGNGSFASRAAAPALDKTAGEAPPSEQRLNSIGKVSEIKLDAELQKKSEEVERQGLKEKFNDRDLADAPSRGKRREQIALPESIPEFASEREDDQLVANLAGPVDLRISTFESEIDPFDFSLLDSGHFVLFRKVWRGGERYIQGLLIEKETFTDDVIGARFKNTALSDMSNLIVAYHDDVLHTFSGRGDLSYPNVAADLDGELLYRSRLSAPLSSLALIFSIQRLPPGPGGRVLGWVTLVLALVFAGGFMTLYRLGLSQIKLARQQQDFVSAVSHELKTPLTSIRMYGEMLKEGWVDEEKQQRYYEFIHDESERLSRLISNVLQLAKITRNDPQYDLQATSVGELMRNAQSKIANQVERAGFELKFNSVDGVNRSMINIDQDCFTQIVINLVDNAIKFSRNADQKIIEINSKPSGQNQVSFSVRDYGPGIPKDQMQKIFQLFYRSESELTRETVGTGIGLAIVHQLTLAMNGRVDMINAKPGAEFRLFFKTVG